MLVDQVPKSYGASATLNSYLYHIFWWFTPPGKYDIFIFKCNRSLNRACYINNKYSSNEMLIFFNEKYNLLQVIPKIKNSDRQLSCHEKQVVLFSLSFIQLRKLIIRDFFVYSTYCPTINRSYSSYQNSGMLKCMSGKHLWDRFCKNCKIRDFFFAEKRSLSLVDQVIKYNRASATEILYF